MHAHLEEGISKDFINTGPSREGYVSIKKKNVKPICGLNYIETVFESTFLE